NSFNQASSGNFGPGELIFTQVSGSSFDGAPGSLNQGPRGSNVILLGSPQGSGFNFGSQAGSNFRGSNFNAGRPVSNLVTGFGPRFEQRPNSYYGSSSLPQGPRSSFPIFTLGSTQGSLRQIPSGFESRSPFGSSFRQGSSSTGSGFGTEFNVSPARGSFQGSSVGSGISQGNLQTSIKEFGAGSQSSSQSSPNSGLTFNQGNPSFNSFNQGNPSFNSFNQASSGNVGTGGIFTSQLISSSNDAAPGNSNRGSSVTFGSSNTGSTSGSSTFDVGQSSGFRGNVATPSRGYLPPSK
ncbi:unnamed protein product, partial [Meganyctiphanes norvegica]